MDKIFKNIGASSHSIEEREENDYYASPPEAAEWLEKIEKLDEFISEPACGEGHLAKVLDKNHRISPCDIIDRGYGSVVDFFSIEKFTGDVVTNPPYKMGQEFVEHALKIIPEGNKVCMLLRTLFVEGQKRGKFFKENPPARIWVSSKRLTCAKNGEFDKYQSGAVSYSWFIWEKGYKGDTILKWFN